MQKNQDGRGSLRLTTRTRLQWMKHQKPWVHIAAAVLVLLCATPAVALDREAEISGALSRIFPDDLGSIERADIQLAAEINERRFAWVQHWWPQCIDDHQRAQVAKQLRLAGLEMWQIDHVPEGVFREWVAAPRRTVIAAIEAWQDEKNKRDAERLNRPIDRDEMQKVMERLTSDHHCGGLAKDLRQDIHRCGIVPLPNAPFENVADVPGIVRERMPRITDRALLDTTVFSLALEGSSWVYIIADDHVVDVQRHPIPETTVR